MNFENIGGSRLNLSSPCTDILAALLGWHIGHGVLRWVFHFLLILKNWKFKSIWKIEDERIDNERIKEIVRIENWCVGKSKMTIFIHFWIIFIIPKLHLKLVVLLILLRVI